MTHGSMFLRMSRFASALVIAGALFGSVTAVPTFAEKKSNLPDGTKCVRVATNFNECTTPDGTVWWCTDDGTCEKAPKIIIVSGGFRPVGGLLANPGYDTELTPFQPIAPISGLRVAP